MTRPTRTCMHRSWGSTESRSYTRPWPHLVTWTYSGFVGSSLTADTGLGGKQRGYTGSSLSLTSMKARSGSSTPTTLSPDPTSAAGFAGGHGITALSTTPPATWSLLTQNSVVFPSTEDYLSSSGGTLSFCTPPTPGSSYRSISLISGRFSLLV